MGDLPFADGVRAHGGSVIAHDRVAPADVAAALAQAREGVSS